MRTILPMLRIDAIPAFTDNYLWLLHDGARAVVVDPGDAQPVLRALEAQALQLEAVLITHWHPDHTGGIAALTAHYPVPVYGPRAEQARIPQITQALDDGARIEVLSRTFEVTAVPGHTLGHIAYRSGELLFCGDTLFSAGCGRLFEGTPAQMYTSLQNIAALPPQTRVYCTHEYTLSNLAFAQAVEPHNAALAARYDEVRALRANHQPSLPITLARELEYNPFLRCSEPPVIAAAQARAREPLLEPAQVFAVLRKWKDEFKSA